MVLAGWDCLLDLIGDDGVQQLVVNGVSLRLAKVVAVARLVLEVLLLGSRLLIILYPITLTQMWSYPLTVALAVEGSELTALPTYP